MRESQPPSSIESNQSESNHPPPVSRFASRVSRSTRRHHHAQSFANAPRRLTNTSSSPSASFPSSRSVVPGPGAGPRVVVAGSAGALAATSAALALATRTVGGAPSGTTTGVKLIASSRVVVVCRVSIDRFGSVSPCRARKEG